VRRETKQSSDLRGGYDKTAEQEAASRRLTQHPLRRGLISKAQCFSLKGGELGAGAEVVALELQIETAACKSKLTRGARDVAAVTAKSVRNHAPLYLGKRNGERNVLQVSIGHRRD